MRPVVGRLGGTSAPGGRSALAGDSWLGGDGWCSDRPERLECVEDTLVEYELPRLCPEGHIMEMLQKELVVELVASETLLGCAGEGGTAGGGRRPGGEAAAAFG